MNERDGLKGFNKHCSVEFVACGTVLSESVFSDS
jgi:hypothetical protein